MKKLLVWPTSHMQPILPVLMVVLLNLGGCTGFLITPYGNIAKDGDPLDIIMPEEAPTIFHGFYTHAPGTATAGKLQNHEAIDIFAEVGTAVIAPASGAVAFSGYNMMIGNYIIIEHAPDDKDRHIITKYQHLDTVVVARGDVVDRGEQIGTLGRTGALSAGIPHLHFETRERMTDSIFRQTRGINPHLFWVEGPGMVSCYSTALDYPVSVFRITYPVPCRGVERF